ncbi:MAG TPA: diiron oxygenase [Alphaproteobacteria bacterium]|nr:diiron oxygenase [Alphaproteobacteria bacterium]
MTKNVKESADRLARGLRRPASGGEAPPDARALLFGAAEPPPFPDGNIFPIEWHTETPRLLELYEKARDPGWHPGLLPWETLKPEDFAPDERYALAYWFALLSVFDSSGPAVFARAFIHTYETHQEDPIRKCFFSIVRDETHHEEVCQRAIQTLTTGGPLGYEPTTPLGRLAQNNVRWYFHNGARYWEGFTKGIRKYELPILFTSFLMGEVASSTLFHTMYQRTTIPAFKEAFRRVGQDEARHMGICLVLLKKVLPKLDRAQKEIITRQLRAGYVFLSGILYEPPDQFWELPESFRPAHRLIEDVARGAGLGILTLEERRENWRGAILKMKGLVEPYGVEFPEIPEIGIDGKTVAFDPEELVPVF